MRAKDIVIGIMLVGVLAGIFIWYQRSRALPPAATPSTTRSTEPIATPQVSNATITKVTPAYRVSAEYPRVSGVQGAAVIKVNEQLRAFAEAQVANFVGEAPVQLESEDPQEASTFDLRSTTSLLTTELASFEFAATTYLSGAAHPVTLVFAKTYSLQTGKEFSLGDLLGEPGDYLHILSTHTRTALGTAYPELAGDAFMRATMEAGTAPGEENFQAVSLSNKGLIVSFSNYQVGPYALGTPRVTLPYQLFSTSAPRTSPIHSL